MFLAQIKEREYRFKLALRMGLPIFALILAFVSNTFINNYESLQTSFYLSSVLLLAISIYFIFYLIYNGFDVKITDHVSKTFAREYLYKYLKKELKKNDEYTLILLSIDNLSLINSRYGIKNGDKVLFEVAQYISKYLKDKKIHNYPMGHLKGGDFILGLKGNKESFKTVIELLCLKSLDLNIDEIEVNISGVITDTAYSKDIDYMVEKLFEIQEENKHQNIIKREGTINPSELESFVLEAINKRRVAIMTQEVQNSAQENIKECYVKLKNHNGKILHPKSYIKIINKLGLRYKYDILILEKAIEHCVNDGESSISILVSPSTIRHYNFLEKMQELLLTNPKAKNKIILITSEVEYYSNIQKYNTRLQDLRKNGVKIAIDRLGSLHTSFLSLRDLDIDIVRFDTLYTKNILSKNNKSIVEGFNTTAHSLGVKTWLRMVENEEVNSFAQEIKIDYIQGKEFSPLEQVYED